MKKFLLFFAAILFGLTTNAQTYVSVDQPEDIEAGASYVFLNAYGWGPGTFLSTGLYAPYHNQEMDVNMQAGVLTNEYNGIVNAEGAPTEFLFEDAGDGNFYFKNTGTGKYVRGRQNICEETDAPVSVWTVTGNEVDFKGTTLTAYTITTIYNGGTRIFDYAPWGKYINGDPTFTAASNASGQPMRIFKKVGGDAPVVPTSSFKGEVVPNLTSVSSLADLEGIQLTFVDADQVSVSEYGDGIYVQDRIGNKFYAIWHPGFGGTYEINGNVVTLYNFFSDNSDGYFDELDASVTELYFEDYGTFDVNNADLSWDGYCQTFSVAYENATPAPQPFELIVKNNNIVCANYGKVEAAEYGLATDFYLGNEGLTAVGKTATLYKDGSAMSFIMTYVANNGVSFFGGASQITEPGTYTLEIPEGTYVDAAGNPSIAFYGSWVIIQKDEPVVDPTQKAKYTIKLNDTDFYFTTTEVADHAATTYSISATPEYFYIEPANGGFTIQSADTDKYVGYNVSNSWDFSNDATVWTISNLEGEPTLIRKDGSRGFGVDNIWEGAGVYTDKTYQYWVIEKVVETEPTEWNGNVNYSEAASIDDLLNVTVEFEEAASVEASGFDVLGAIFDETGDAYGIVLANGVFDVFGSVTFNKGVASVGFQKIADLDAPAQSRARAALKGITPASQGKATVVFAGKSFVVDGALVSDLLCQEYEFVGGTQTGISSAAVEGAARVFDLQGRRVKAAQKGLFIQNGQKVVR